MDGYEEDQTMRVRVRIQIKPVGGLPIVDQDVVVCPRKGTVRKAEDGTVFQSSQQPVVAFRNGHELTVSVEELGVFI